MKIKLFPLAEMEKKPIYKYHYDPINPTLLKSIREQGILSPLWILNKKGGLILDGYRRLEIIRHLEFKTVPAVLVGEKDLQNAFVSVLNINITQMPLSQVEKLKAFWISKKYFSTVTAEKVSEILELAYIPSILPLATWICQRPFWLQRYVHQAKFSLKQLEKIQRYSGRDYIPWLKLASQISVNGTELIQILDSINDISLRLNISVSDLWNFLDVKNLIEGNLTAHQKSSHLKLRIEKKRMPVRHEINRKVEKYIKQFPKGFLQRFEIRWDKNLEEQGIKVNFWLKDDSEIDGCIKQLNDQNIRNKIKNLFDLINQIPDKT